MTIYIKDLNVIKLDFISKSMLDHLPSRIDAINYTLIDLLQLNLTYAKFIKPKCSTFLSWKRILASLSELYNLTQIRRGSIIEPIISIWGVINC